MMPSRRRYFKLAFGVLDEWTSFSFRCRWLSASWAERQRRGGERQIRFAPRYPRAVRRGLTAGSLSKTGPAPNASTTPICQGTLLRNASPNLTPERVRFGQQRLFLPPCTAHSFSARRKRMGGASLSPKGKRTAGTAVLFVFFRTPRCPRCGDGAARPGYC